MEGVLLSFLGAGIAISTDEILDINDESAMEDEFQAARSDRDRLGDSKE